jgi:hypothetical protein
MTTNMTGRMKITIGKSILTGAFWARSSASACQRFLRSTAWFLRICVRDMPMPSD